MTEHLDKQTLTRLAWITELRRQGHRKCEGDYFDFNDEGEQTVCALGLLIEVSGFRIGRDPHDEPSMSEVGELAGLTEGQSEAVWMMNDGYNTVAKLKCDVSFAKHTFSEIADVVDGWFSK